MNTNDCEAPLPSDFHRLCGPADIHSMPATSSSLGIFKVLGVAVSRPWHRHQGAEIVL
jgi:hypothetical protein